MRKLKILSKKLTFKGMDTILRLGHIMQLAFISAVNDENRDIPELRKEQTDKLESYIARRWDYLTSFGGWVEYPKDPETGKEDKTKLGKDTIEETFIVLGEPYIADEESKRKFIKDMCDLCGKYNQWAVMILEGVEKIDEVSFKQLKDRYDAYSVFGNPKYIEEEIREEMKNTYGDELERSFNCIEQRILPIAIYRVDANYYDSEGTVLKHYENVSTSRIADYFTTIFRDVNAPKFTFIADDIKYYSKFQPNNISEARIIPKRADVLRESILANRESFHYKWTHCSKYTKLKIADKLIKLFL